MTAYTHTSLLAAAKACSGAAVNLSCLPQPAGGGSALIPNLLTIAIRIIAAISVLFVAIGGMRYVLSQGDPQGVSKAKGTIMYALIGLAVAIIAQGIVVLVVKVVD